MNLWTRVVVLAALLIVAAGAAAAHGALIKLNKGRIRFLAEEGVPRARLLLDLAEDASSLGATLVAANAAALASSAAMVALLIADYSGAGSAYGIGLASLVLLPWVQLASHAAGSAHPEGTLYLLRWPLQAADVAMRPLTLSMSGLTRLVVRGDREAAAAGLSPADEELRMIVDAVEEESPLEEDEKEMIHGIFEMGETTVREVMVPRVDMVAVKADRPLGEVLEKIKSRGHSRIPIYEETIDNVVGVVYAKDLLRYMETGSLDQPARSLSRPPHFVPEAKKIDELLHEMQRNKVHMVIVVDEYGGTAGLATIEDLLEEIVGEIHDEYDVEEKTVEKLSEREAVFDARVSIHDVNETLDISLANGEYDTVGGLVYDRLGKIPVVGDEVDVNGVRVTVLSTARKRIGKVKVLVESVPSPDRGRESRD